MASLVISDIEIGSSAKSMHFKPLQLSYKLNNVERSQIVVQTRAGVSIVIYNTTRNVLIAVKQFRPAVYYTQLATEDKSGIIDLQKYPVKYGITLELCAGVADKNIPLEEIAREEILEECGYDVPVTNLTKIISYPSGLYGIGDTQTLYYCEVTDSMKVGARESDSIEVVELSISELCSYLSEKSLLTPPLSLLGFYWFLHNKVPLLQKKLHSKL